MFFGKPDCGEGDANWPTKGPCDPPEGPCQPMGKPGYPSKPRPPKEPFCVECPEKKPCNLNKCPESEGTSRDLFQKISFILNYKSQRSSKISGIHVRHYGILRQQCGPLMIQSRHGCGGSSSGKPPETVGKCKKEEKPEKISCTPDKNKIPCGKPEEKAPDPAPIKVVYQQCPPVPELPKVPECVNPPMPVPPKCPPLPEVPKCPPVETKCPAPAQNTGTPCAKKNGGKCSLGSPASKNSAQDLWGKFTSCFKKRGMSTDARNFSSDSNDFKEKRCKTISEICDKRSKSSLNDKCETTECPKNQRTSCRLERVKCPGVKGKAVPPIEKIDYSKITCERPKFEKLGSCPTSKSSVCPDQNFFVCDDGLGMVNGKAKLPKPPSLPVVLCPCSPPPKLSPGSCPCADVTLSQKSPTKPAEPPKSCPQKLKYPCPETRVFYCPLNPQSQRSKCQK